MTTTNRDTGACLTCGDFFARDAHHDCPLPGMLDQVDNPMAGSTASEWSNLYGAWSRTLRVGDQEWSQLAQKRSGSDIVDVITDTGTSSWTTRYPSIEFVELEQMTLTEVVDAATDHIVKMPHWPDSEHVYRVGPQAPTDPAEIRETLLAGGYWISWIDDFVTAALTRIARLSGQQQRSA